MTRIQQTMAYLLVAIMFVCGLGAPDYSAAANEDVSTDGTIYVRGLIQDLSVDELQIVVRPLKGRSIVITVGLDTVVEGFERIEQLEKKQQVKVWYKDEGNEHKAVKIEKLMNLGC